MLTNELLYTALTRASDRLLFVTNQPLSERVLSPFVHATAYSVKTSYLADALEKAMTKKHEEEALWRRPFATLLDAEEDDDMPY